MSLWSRLFGRDTSKDFEPFSVQLPAITLHIYPDSKLFPYEEFRGGKLGYVERDGNIHILGKKLDGGIDFQDLVGGHELQHLANWADPRIIHPHKDED